MTNKRKGRFIMATAAISLLSAIPVQAAGAVSGNIPVFSQEEIETISYIIDFLDYDGNLLDSKVCMYGEKLENIPIPERPEDEQYIYQFAGWEPELQETVSDCAFYTAVYERKAKSAADGDNGSGQDSDENEFEPETEEQSEFSPKVLSNGTDPERLSQISAISYDVISFQTEEKEERITSDPVPAISEKPLPEKTDSQSPPVPSLPVNSVSKTESAEKSDKPNSPWRSFSRTEEIALNPVLPDISGVQEIHSQNVREQKEPSADIDAKTVFSGEKKEKKPLANSVKVKKLSAPSPTSLKKSRQRSRTGDSPFLWPGIFAGCMGSILFLLKNTYLWRNKNDRPGSPL